MDGAGIHHGDILVVDRSIQPVSGHVVVAFVGGERLVKTLRISGGLGQLVAENPNYPPISITEDCVIWGVVTGRFAKVPV